MQRTAQERATVQGSDETLSVTAAAEQLGVSRWTVWRMIAEGNLDAENAMRGSRVVTRVQLPIPCEDEPEGSPPRSRTARLQERVDRLTHSVECLSEMLLQAERERVELREELERQAAAGRSRVLASRRVVAEPPFPAAVHPFAPAPAIAAPREPEPLVAGDRLIPAVRARSDEPSVRLGPSPAPLHSDVKAVVAPAENKREAVPLRVVSESGGLKGEGLMLDVFGLAAPVADEPFPPGITARPNPMTHPTSAFKPSRGPSGEELLQPVRHLFKREERRRSWWQKLPVARS
jgi:excisionase family DNA binding protein